VLRAVSLLGIAALVLASCGTGGKAVSPSHADQGNGQKLFQSTCGGCHALAAAGSSGTSGPNLDAAFGPSRKQGFKQSTIQNVVLDQIRLAAAPMPKNLVTGEDAQDVAAYVAAVAGQGGGEAKPPSALGNDGKTIFQSQCASCHTLKAANASGTIGPNLDQLKPDAARVQHQVEVGGGVMPAFKGKLTDQQIQAVAKFVADSAGK
jgi:cbb3-type cytochrome c oxidase subunit III